MTLAPTQRSLSTTSLGNKAPSPDLAYCSNDCPIGLLYLPTSS